MRGNSGQRAIHLTVQTTFPSVSEESESSNKLADLQASDDAEELPGRLPGDIA